MLQSWSLCPAAFERTQGQTGRHWGCDGDFQVGEGAILFYVPQRVELQGHGGDGRGN